LTTILPVNAKARKKPSGESSRSYMEKVLQKHTIILTEQSNQYLKIQQIMKLKKSTGNLNLL
jgi:hypothetical protein